MYACMIYTHIQDVFVRVFVYVCVCVKVKELFEKTVKRKEKRKTSQKTSVIIFYIKSNNAKKIIF